MSILGCAEKRGALQVIDGTGHSIDYGSEINALNALWKPKRVGKWPVSGVSGRNP